MASSFLDRLAAAPVLIADGATGTNLQVRGLPRGVPADVWVLERPAEVLALHRDFIQAGSDLLLTCTFGATPPRLETAGLAERAAEINRQAAGLARQAARERDALVGGSIGPTGQLLEPLGPLPEADAEEIFFNQARVLAEAGVDLLVIETLFDLAEASTALRAARRACSLPVVVSFSYDRGTRTMMGVRPAQMAKEMESGGASCLGINCGRSLTENVQALDELRNSTSLPIWFKPNAGLPRMVDEQAIYDLTPEAFGAEAASWVSKGARIIGGCCGTSPAHLRAIASAAREAA